MTEAKSRTQCRAKACTVGPPSPMFPALFCGLTGFDERSHLGVSIQAHRLTPLNHRPRPMRCQHVGVSLDQISRLSETQTSGRLERDAQGRLTETQPFHLRSRQSPSILRSSKRTTASKSILTHPNVAALDGTGIQLYQSVRI